MDVQISRDPARLVAFTDAVVAIALTLLVLPLVEVVPDSPDAEPATQVIGDHAAQIFAFLLSFLVIGRLWMIHHRVFNHVVAYTGGLLRWNMGWVLAIIVLPLATAMTGVYGSDRFTVSFYVGTVLAASLCQTAMSIIIDRDPGVTDPADDLPDMNLNDAFAATALLTAILVIAVSAPFIGYWAFLLMALSGRTAKLIGRLRARRATR